MSEAITFLVPGQDQTRERGGLRSAAPAAREPLRRGTIPQGTVKQSVRVGNQRAAGGDVALTAMPGRDAVVLHIAGGPALTLHPETARQLLLAQADGGSTRGESAALPDGTVKVPIELRWGGLEETVATRGAQAFFGRVTMTAMDVITDLVTDKVADFTASKVAERVDAQVDNGVYRLTPDSLPLLKGNGGLLSRVPPPPDGAPMLVLAHGTFSNTSGTFSPLWTHHPDRVRSLFERYKGEVYGLDHPTLRSSPIENAATLVEALPANARLHLLTHSRGGLVAEVLSRVCADPGACDTFSTKDAKALGQLKSLSAVVKAKNIRVDRVLRVACPARGTLLASNRLDAYLSVFNWVLELAGIPILPALVDFLAAVATRRKDEDLLPGLAAQIPDSSLVQWLHAATGPLPGDLRVVAGDVKGDSVTSWLKTLLSDGFFWTDNDFVVQTRSMYGGAARASMAQFVLDQGGTVSHFGYFANARTAEAIVNGLLENQPQNFQTIGPLSLAGKSSTGTRAPRRDDGKPPSEKPALFVLPGMLASHLRLKDERIWLDWRIVNGLSRLDYTGKPDGIEPDGAIESFYQGLCDFFADSHQVIQFAFDWRKPIEEEARRLAAAVDDALSARAASGQPVRMIAHSMGGLVARTMHLEAPAVWARMMAAPGARILMLGTPNGGSWMPMQVLSGDDTFGNTLGVAGAPFRQAEARALMAKLPGFLQLQAGLLDDARNLKSEATWRRLKADDVNRIQERSGWHRLPLQLDCVEWGVPPQDVLDQAVALRRRLDAQAADGLAAFSDKLLLVVGSASSTPDGFELGDTGLVYLDAQHAGDGRVTLESAVLPGVRTWKVDADHGRLPSAREAFDAYRELIQSGTTRQLETLESDAGRRAAAPAVAHVRHRPSRAAMRSRPPEGEQDLFATEQAAVVPTPADSGAALRVTMTNGDLSFVQQPLMIGHYSATRLTGTEAVMNKLSGQVMEVSLNAGLYPDTLGTHQIFVNTGESAHNPLQPPRPEAVIVVGLGEEGKLRPSELAAAIRQAVIAWAQHMAERDGPREPLFEIAATLIGSGGSGITAGQAAQLIAQGVREANGRLEDEADPKRRWPSVGHLQLIELYHDRAVEAWRALQLQAAAMPGQYVVGDVVQTGIGWLRRPLDSGYRGADYDFIRAASEGKDGASGVISYTLDTRRARTEVRAQSMQMNLLRTLVETASNDRNTDPQIGRTLFQLLVPIEVEPFLAGTTEMQIELDRGTAGLPWELLDTNTNDRFEEQPWAIRAKLLRKLRTTSFRAQVADATVDARVLVIGEPECDSARYPRLPGAREEALAVLERLTGPQGIASDRVSSLIGADEELFGGNARVVINALLQHDWRIVHIAGHGEPPEAPQAGDQARSVNQRGVVLSDGAFLGPNEIASMRRVPELVFVNCCHLAARNPARLLERRSPDCDRCNWPEFAFGVAEALIDAGVRCVIAAGWAVEDGAANLFATTFYEALLRGRRFIDAVADARTAAHDLGGNTWAAYQCYGDPDWYFRREGTDPQRPVKPLGDEFAAVASPSGLLLALETLAVRSEFQRPFGSKPQEAFRESQRAKLRHLEARFAAMWGGRGDVAEAFGAAWGAADDPDTAIRWYRSALAANDGTASRKAGEQLGNLEVRVAWGRVDAARQALEAAQEEANGAAGPASSGRRARLAKAKAEQARASREARAGITRAIDLLKRLSAVQSTMEVESLIGSAYKRLAMVEDIAGRSGQVRQAFAHMKRSYERAEAVGREQRLSGLYYPIMNRLATELVLNVGQAGWKGLDPDAVQTVRQELDGIARENPDFWSVVGQTELTIYEAISGRRLKDELPPIARALRDVHARIGARSKWRSVYDQMRLVVGRYQQVASREEAEAAEALLALASGMALGEGAARQPRPASSARVTRRTAAAARKRSPGRA